MFESVFAGSDAASGESRLMSPEAGMRYRKMVLAPGGTGRIMDHLTAFIGRAPEQTAFLKSKGVLA
jgi:Zn-dependent oligopeptidase